MVRFYTPSCPRDRLVDLRQRRRLDFGNGLHETIAYHQPLLLAHRFATGQLTTFGQRCQAAKTGIKPFDTLFGWHRPWWHSLVAGLLGGGG